MGLRCKASPRLAGGAKGTREKQTAIPGPRHLEPELVLLKVPLVARGSDDSHRLVHRNRHDDREHGDLRGPIARRRGAQITEADAEILRGQGLLVHA